MFQIPTHPRVTVTARPRVWQKLKTAVRIVEMKRYHETIPYRIDLQFVAIDDVDLLENVVQIPHFYRTVYRRSNYLGAHNQYSIFIYIDRLLLKWKWLLNSTIRSCREREPIFFQNGRPKSSPNDHYPFSKHKYFSWKRTVSALTRLLNDFLENKHIPDTCNGEFVAFAQSNVVRYKQFDGYVSNACR